MPAASKFSLLLFRPQERFGEIAADSPAGGACTARKRAERYVQARPHASGDLPHPDRRRGVLGHLAGLRNRRADVPERWSGPGERLRGWERRRDVHGLQRVDQHGLGQLFRRDRCMRGRDVLREFPAPDPVPEPGTTALLIVGGRAIATIRSWRDRARGSISRKIDFMIRSSGLPRSPTQGRDRRGRSSSGRFR